MHDIMTKIFSQNRAQYYLIAYFCGTIPSTDCVMADLSIIVSEIELKLRKMLDEKHQLAVENKRLVEENAALEKENLTLRQSTMELQDKINKSTIVNALDNEGEVEEGRKLIKELVREIDRCVSILNSKE